MPPRPDRLDVYYGSALVGAVYDSAPLAFEYAPAWLGGPLRMTLAAIALQPGRQATPEVQAFFENLLPEGRALDIPDRDHNLAVGDKVYKHGVLEFLQEA